MFSRTKFPWLYLILSYAFAWVFWIPVALTGQDYQSSQLLLITVLIGVFGPGIAGIMLTYLQGDQAQRRDFWRRMLDVRRIRPVWFLVILFLYPTIQLLTLALNKMLGGAIPASELVQELIAQPAGIPVVIVLYLIQAGLEELGWRGYMLERLLPGWGAMKSSLIIGLFHAFWHLPMFWVVGTNQIQMGFDIDFLLFVVQVFAFSVITTWVYIGAGHSTLAATLLHGVGNLCLDVFAVAPGALKNNLLTLLMVAVAAAISAGWLGLRKRQQPDIYKEVTE
jgi:membrane protease YdiL (CAAX protease family)